MRTGLSVLAPGETVTIGGDIRATIVALMIGQADAVSYKLAWWSGRELRQEWVDGGIGMIDFGAIDAERLTMIGLRSGGSA